MPDDAIFEFKGYQIPIRLIWLTGGVVDTFGPSGEFDMDRLEKSLGLSSGMHIVEIGCGIGRDAIALSERLSDQGSYLGIDINREQIDWCTANITARHPNIRFEHWNVREQFYNPSGTLSLSECQIPERSSSVDRIILQSVFTHLLPDDLKYYLKEFRRDIETHRKRTRHVFQDDR